MKYALRAGLMAALLAGPAMAQDQVSRADMALHQADASMTSFR